MEIDGVTSAFIVENINNKNVCVIWNNEKSWTQIMINFKQKQKKKKKRKTIQFTRK